MALTSSDISGMIGGQMAMFGNQAQFSQQIGVSSGMAPMGSAGGGFQNPYPNENTGAKIAGGMAMAAPGAMAGMSLAGGFLGGPLAAFDPFTMGARGFAGGVGAGGMGFGGTMGHIGRTFAQGGMRAGMGALGGGLAGAAVAAAPIMLAGAAIDFAAGNMYQGAQNVSEIGGMAQQYMGPSFGQTGSRWGGGMSRQTIKGMTSALHEIVGEDSQATMVELKRVMDMAGRAGMLTGIQDAQTFKTKIQGIFKQAKEIANIMGTTIAEGGAAMMQMNQMGLWKTSDIIGTSMAARVAGPQATPQLMQTMQAGAQLSHAMGGSMAAGAMMGQQSFMALGAATRAGVMRNEDVMRYTGGVGGSEGQAMMAQNITEIMSRYGQTSAGRLMMAGLGATEKGEFTGEIDKGRLNKFLRGGVGINQLQAQGQKVAGSRRGAMSFFTNEEEMAQNLGAEGGLQAMQQIVEQVIPKVSSSAGDYEQVRHHLIRQMFNVSNREAKMLSKLMDDMPRIRDQQIKETQQALDQAFQDVEQKQFRSMDAFKQSMEHIWKGATRPFQEAGERLATDFNEVGDRMSDWWNNRTRKISMGGQERARLLRGGALTTDLSSVMPGNIGQDWVNGDWRSNMNMRMRESGFGGRLMGSAALGAAVGTASGIPGGGLIGGVTGAGAELFGIGEADSPRARALKELGIGGATGSIDLGGGVRTDRGEMERGVRRAYMRAQSPAASALGIDDDKKLREVRSLLSKTIGKHSGELARMKKEEPEKYASRVLELMGKEDTTGALSGLDGMKKLDYLAVAQQEEGFGNSGDLSVDFKGSAMRVGMPDFSNPTELAKLQNNLLDNMTEAAGGRNIGMAMLQGAGAGAVGGAIAGAGIGAVAGAVVGGLGAGIYAAVRDSGITRDQIEGAMTGPGSEIFMDFVKGKIKKEDAIASLARVKGGDKTRQLVEFLDKNQDVMNSFKEAAPKFEQYRMAQIQPAALESLQTLAEGGPESVKSLEGSTAGRKFTDIVRAYRGGAEGKLTTTLVGQAQEESEKLAGELSEKEALALKHGGGDIGRNIYAQYRAGKLGAMSEDQLARVSKEFSHMGYNLEDIVGERGKELMKGGISKEEEKEFGALVKGGIKTSMAASADAAQTTQDKMAEQLRLYTDANKKFVEAVNQALGHKLEDAEKQLEEQRKKTVATAPTATK